MSSLANHLQSFEKTYGDNSAFDELLTQSDQTLKNLQSCKSGLVPIFNAAPYLLDCARFNLVWFEASLAQPVDEIISQILHDADTAAAPEVEEHELRKSLRQLKRRIALVTAVAEVSGAITAEITTKSLALFADKCLDAALDNLTSARFTELGIEIDPTIRPARQSGLTILALGKHGGLELNYSSDIDIVAFYDLSRCPFADNKRVARIYEKIVRDLTSFMQDRDENGYVFRTDLRLRPDPGSTPVAISVGAAMSYYESRGQNWERAAWIKARPCAGDIQAGDAFLQELSPFIWRKHLDFATIGDIKAIKRQINTAKNIAGRMVLGHNVKLGSGGIREIEFFAQVQQLIAGGRDPLLRTRSTSDTLNALAATNWIDREIAIGLVERYWFLRAVENRVQMINDEQTHALPDNDQQLEPIVALLPFKDVEAFKSAYRTCIDAVVDHYGELFRDDDEGGDLGNLVFTGSDDDPQTWTTLSDIGFKDPSKAIETIRRWHYGSYAATRADRARQNLTTLVPSLLRAISNARNADESLRQFDFFLSKLPTGIQLFALLQNNLRLQHLLIDFMAAAPRMTDAILTRVHIVDGLIDPAFYDDVPSPETINQKAQEFLGEARSYEDLIDRARIFGQEQIFLISAGLVAGTLAVDIAARQFSALAEVLMNWVFEAVRREFEVKHGKVEGAEVALLAFGKLASREMNAQSDLDFILIYDAPEGSDQSNGQKPLATSQYFIRLTQRLVAAISAPTAQGVLYETDMRLRPSGNAGPLATSLKGFENYQRNDAWTWEHMALSRARAVLADGTLEAKISSVIQDVLAARQDVEKTTADVLDMRQKLLKDRPAKSVWDIKLADGGLIDLEFMVQFAQLSDGKKLGVPQAPPLEVFAALSKQNKLIDFEQISMTYHLYTVIMQLSAACLIDPLPAENWSDGFVELLTRTCNFPSLELLAQELDDRQQSTRTLFASFVK
ncbi:bifunctional [glutamine synthetase] adenylyltransferase/[glutamine synthetase]-adenylyl-L-tyrosine phosphorylase [Maritalea sp.]|uniref:bifunctional [glutamine synthetase] adenylyltransferase/[glutamine synthetase]-adenylyl-L-tyrosine phosphorylase n=1 Tax=Maritalea sp. TaxID=2003361 RepID=UPI003EF58EB8